ncbi:MAG TPA: BTAD domain-containing putative transcriptional regulator, partial [Rhodocyclaceae bacterium]|nr:BTAD domain-containing putative transcriptional regulator [Rhodocyclaceae bacterium]
MPSFPLFLSSFGALGLRWNGKDIAIAGEKPAALLAYLALEPGPHRRESLAELLWPGVPTESARHSLRQTVFNLRNLLMDATGHAFIAGRNQLAWDGESVFTSDVALLLDAVAGDPGAPMDDATRITTLKAAMAVYAGPFLSTLSLADCQDFMDWVHFKREALHLRALELLRRLIDCLESQGRTREALSFALRYTELEPWSEMGYLHAMRLYAADGQRDAALALYETYCRVLERDLGVLPGKDVQALMEDLRHQNRTSAELVSRLEERRQVTVLFCELHVADVSDL